MRFWSFSTTIRNPERIRDFLSVLKELEGCEWNSDTQSLFQVYLIYRKVYGYGNTQFNKSLSEEQINALESPNLTLEQAQDIFNSKKYEDPPMRGRQSFNPLAKLGLVYLEENLNTKKKHIKISDFGNEFLRSDYSLKDIFLRALLKWQYPNPDDEKYKVSDGYNIKPFVATLSLISEVNKICLDRNLKVKGVSRIEFAMFFVSLVNYKDIQKVAKNLLEFREKHSNMKNNKDKSDFIINYFKENFSSFESWENALEYSDNIIRYFRLTGLIYIRGNGFYIDLEQRRIKEIDALLKVDNCSAIEFSDKLEYIEYLSNPNTPTYPWEELEIQIETRKKLLQELYSARDELNTKGIKYNSKEIELLENEGIEINTKSNNLLREKIKELNYLLLKSFSQEVENIEIYIQTLKNIFEIKYDRPLILEKYIFLGFNALNDLERIQPNYPVGDDNEPTFTAPAKVPDLECFYAEFNAISEVTLLSSRNQWYAEGQPVLRHLRDFENKNYEKESYCVFIAPKLHQDTINTFWFAVKYEYEGKKQKIIPLTITQFIDILEILKSKKHNNKNIKSGDIRNLYDEIINKTISVENSLDWISSIPEIINNWGKKF